MTDLTEALKGLSLSHVKIDNAGRVLIDNPDVAKKLKDLGAPQGSSASDGNGLCCGNTNCASPELTSLLQRIVSGRTG